MIVSSFGGIIIMVNYKKLWVLLAQKGMSKAQLRKEADISSATLTKLNKNEIVALTVLIKICKVLECDIGKIIEIII